MDQYHIAQLMTLFLNEVQASIFALATAGCLSTIHMHTTIQALFHEDKISCVLANELLRGARLQQHCWTAIAEPEMRMVLC